MNKSVDDGALLDAILEAAVDAIIVSDERGIILRANQAACDMFLQDLDALVGLSVNKLMPDGMAALHNGFMRHHIDSGERRIIGTAREVEGLRDDGTVFPVRLSVGHAHVGDTRVFIGIMHDLTDRKTTEDALARSQRLDAVGQMTGGIAHDFNNLLTIIMGNLELLEIGGVNDNQSKLIKDAIEAAELGSDLTSRLMLFARKGDLKPVKADLRELCKAALAILKRTLSTEIAIKTDFAPRSSAVMIDPIQLQSALMNLTLNARDAMGDKGELLISVADVNIDDTYMAQEIDVEPGNYVRLSISDDGDGMTEEAQTRAFEPFFTTKSNHGGTGLGLAMVYGFVRQSGGHITLYSEPGLGTSFGLYFPALPEDLTQGPASGKTETDAPLSFSGGLTVLVVEDNPKVLAISAKRLEDLGFFVKQAESGDEALAMLNAGTKIDILFSDLVMPGALNGFDLAARAAQDFPHLKILLTSGYASDVVTTRMAQGQNYKILHKPFRQAELINRLQALLAEGPGA